MKIQEAATKIISAWEHTGHYDCHGDGAYGLIGWQGGELRGLLHEFLAAGGTLKRHPGEYAVELLDDDGSHQDDELNCLAKTPLMQRVQREQASRYMERAIEWQWRFYPFKTALGQLICCDIGVNSGIENFYVKNCGGTLKNDEASMLVKVMEYRRSALKGYGIWQKYKGIRRRWQFYNNMLYPDSLDLSDCQPTVQVNGVDVDLGNDPIQPFV